MTNIIISRAQPNAAYQKGFHYGPLTGWAIHINGEFRGISPTQPEAVDKALTLNSDPDPQVTIDSRSEFNRKEKNFQTMSAADYTSGFIGLTGKAELFKTQHELGHQTPQQIFQDLMTD